MYNYIFKIFSYLKNSKFFYVKKEIHNKHLFYFFNNLQIKFKLIPIIKKKDNPIIDYFRKCKCYFLIFLFSTKIYLSLYKIVDSPFSNQ